MAGLIVMLIVKVIFKNQKNCLKHLKWMKSFNSLFFSFQVRSRMSTNYSRVPLSVAEEDRENEVSDSKFLLSSDLDDDYSDNVMPKVWKRWFLIYWRAVPVPYQLSFDSLSPSYPFLKNTFTIDQYQPSNVSLCEKAIPLFFPSVSWPGVGASSLGSEEQPIDLFLNYHYRIFLILKCCVMFSLFLYNWQWISVLQWTNKWIIVLLFWLDNT